jgi:hypothetical protein
MIEFSADRTIEQVLLAGYYKVPRFQRPYSWTADNTGEFWSDIAESIGRDYFIGALIVYTDRASDGERRPDTEYAIVDGQQRLTTIMILLAALRDAFGRVGRDDLAQGIHGYIARADRRNATRFVLETEGGYPYLHAVVQSFPAVERPPDPLRSDEKLIKDAHDYFVSQIASLEQSVARDTTIAPEGRTERFIERLEELRDRVLSLVVILVVVGDIDDAYVIFETLNTRGKDLSLADLVRNFLLRDLREQAGAADLPRDRFNRLLELLQEPGIEINPAEFLHHSWLSRYDYVSRKNLFRDIKANIRTPQQKLAYLRELETDLPIYVRVRRPDSARWPRHLWPVVRSLKALDVFHMTQPVPLVLASLRAYEVERSLTIRPLKRLLRSIEAFHFQFTAIAGRSSSGGISMRYAAHARRFREEEDHARNVEVLLQKLREATPSREEFLAAFTRLAYSSEHTSDKALVRYVLDELYRSATRAVEVNFDAMTIEHLLPERARAGQADAEVIASIGNLILVSEELNNELANKPPHEKLEILRRQRELWVDPLVLAEGDWDASAVAQRTGRMGETAFDSVWRF